MSIPDLGAKDLLNNRMAYVAISRGARDAQLFTNDSERLEAALARDVSHLSALAQGLTQAQSVQPQMPEIEHGHDIGLSL